MQESGRDAVLLAGGTDVMTQLNRDGTARGMSIVHIGGIQELKEICRRDGELYIGALVTAAQLAASPAVCDLAPALAQAAAASAGPQVRNRATIGGNIGTASPAGDLITALWALDATLMIAGPMGIRQQHINEVVVGVKRTSLARDEMITEIRIPRQNKVSAFEKMGKRSAMTISFASVACALQIDTAAGKIASARVAIGAAAPTTVRATALEQALEGMALDGEEIRRAAVLAREAICPSTDQGASRWYRMEVVAPLAAKTIQKAAGVETEEGLA